MVAEEAAMSDPYQVGAWEEPTAEGKLAGPAQDDVQKDLAAAALHGGSDDEDALKKKLRGRGVARFARTGDLGNGRSKWHGYESELPEKPRPEDWKDKNGRHKGRETNAGDVSSGGGGSAEEILAGFRQKWRGRLTGKLTEDTPTATASSDWSAPAAWSKHNDASEWRGGGGGDGEDWGASWDKKEDWSTSWNEKGLSWKKQEDWRTSGKKQQDWSASCDEKGSPGATTTPHHDHPCQTDTADLQCRPPRRSMHPSNDRHGTAAISHQHPPATNIVYQPPTIPHSGRDSQGRRRGNAQEQRDDNGSTSSLRDDDSRDDSTQRRRSVRHASRRRHSRHRSRQRERIMQVDRRRDADSCDSSRRGGSAWDGRKRPLQDDRRRDADSRDSSRRRGSAWDDRKRPLQDARRRDADSRDSSRRRGRSARDGRKRCRR